MRTLAEVQKDVLALPEEDRVAILNAVVESLPHNLPSDEEPDSIDEALRREKQWREDPTQSLTLEELKAAVGRP